MGNRKAATEYILDNVNNLLPDGVNKDLYAEYLNGLTEKQFAAFMQELLEGKKILKLIVPNGNKVKLDIDRNLKLAKKLGHEFFEHLWLTDKATGEVYKTPKKYLILKLANRRQFQTLVNKMSVASSQSVVDQFTNQPAGSSSKTSSLSGPELNMMKAQGYEQCIVEFMKERGGDRKAFNAMNRVLFRDGAVSQDLLDSLNSRPKASTVFNVFLTTAHIDNNV